MFIVSILILYLFLNRSFEKRFFECCYDNNWTYWWDFSVKVLGCNVLFHDQIFECFVSRSSQIVRSILNYCLVLITYVTFISVTIIFVFLFGRITSKTSCQIPFENFRKKILQDTQTMNLNNNSKNCNQMCEMCDRNFKTQWLTVFRISSP